MLGIAVCAPFGKLRIRIRDDILMLDRDRGNADAQQPRRPLRVVACGGHDMFGPDLEHIARRHQIAALLDHLLAGHNPFIACPMIAVHLNLALDLATRHPRRPRHGLGYIGGVDITVCRMENRTPQIICPHQRPAFLDLRGTKELMLDPNGFSCCGIQHIFIHPLLRLRHPQVAAPGKTGIQAGLILKPRIQLDRVIMNMAGRIAHVEQRQKPCGMPCRPGGQFVTFDQQRLPPGTGKMQGNAATDRTASDDKNLYMRFHGTSPLPANPFLLVPERNPYGSIRPTIGSKKRHAATQHLS